MDTKTYDFTYEQAVEITRHVWKGAWEPFILSFAKSLHKEGFKWLTDDCIDFDEAAWITDFLQNSNLD